MKGSPSAIEKQIPRGSRFFQCYSRHGHAIFRLYRILESLWLLILAVILLAFALALWAPAREFAIIVGVIGAIVLGHSLRSAFTSEALVWDASAQLLHWIRATPWSKQSDALGKEERWYVLLVQQECTDDAGQPYVMCNVSICRYADPERGFTAMEWLRVASYSTHAGGMLLAQQLSQVCGRPMTCRHGSIE